MAPMYPFDLEAAISLYYNILIGIIHQSLRTSTITFPQVSRVPRAHPYSIESIVLSKLATTLYVLALLDTINKKMFPHILVGLYDTYIVSYTTRKLEIKFLSYRYFKLVKSLKIKICMCSM